jgi:RNA polymerase sigma-70 factor (ECF subfamily)
MARLRAVPKESRARSPDVRRIATDPDAFEAFYREHVEAVQRFVARRIGDRNRAADLTAEVFVAAIESADRYRSSRGSPVGWLFGIARIVVSADHRRRGRERSATGKILGRRLLGDDDTARMDERIDAEAQARQLYHAMDRLAEGERAVLELVAIDELSVSEAASALGIRPVAARVRLHRARRQMQDELTTSAGDAAGVSQPVEASP